MDRAYYNEIDLYAAKWLRNLIAAGYLMQGDVDTRSIEDVRPDDLRGYRQCHFFAGIGVWPLALRCAGWPDDRSIWSGSCPCQPFSAAGQGVGFDDERHLWPTFGYLIKERRPECVVGEQVASKDADPWIDLVQADMEALGYAFGAVPFPSAGVGAPHIRDRLYWVADSDDARLERRRALRQRAFERVIGARGVARWMAYTDLPKSLQGGASSGQQSICDENGRPCNGDGAGPTNGRWRDADWLGCTDGRWRPVEPGTFPLADGVANRMGKLRAYGNAINAEQARIWIETIMETI